MEMLATRNLSFAYPSGRGFQFPDICLDGLEVMLVLGRSGVGKTTFLHLLAGLHRPTSGSVKINGTDLTGLSSSDADKFRGKNIGMVHQQALFVRSISVLQNLLLAQRLAGLTTDREAALQLLHELNVEDRAHQLPQYLSIGERQRASIARALITQPKIVFADEPTSALDDQNCDRVANLLEDCVTRRGSSLIIVTHDQRLKARFENQIEL